VFFRCSTGATLIWGVASREGWTAKLEADHPRTLTTKHNLAALYRSQGKYAPATALFNEVLAASIARLGTDHPDTLTTRRNLAGLYQDQGQYAQAEILFKEVLAGRTARLGRDHPDTRSTKHNLAALYWSMKQLDRSIPLFEEVVQQAKTLLGAGHPDTLRALANLSVNYRDAGRLDHGIRCLERALAGIRDSPGPCPANLAWVPGELALTYDRAKQYAKSELLYREFLQQGRRRFGNTDPRTAGLMAQLSLNLLAQKKHADAEPLLRDCLAVREKKQPDNWHTANTRSLLGEALLGQKKYAEAEPLLTDGYVVLKPHQDQIQEPFRQTCLTEALQRLVALCEATGRQGEAARWRKEPEAARAAQRGAGR
jgi:tetratricopeptide (TPR) repeat protein